MNTDPTTPARAATGRALCPPIRTARPGFSRLLLAVLLAGAAPLAEAAIPNAAYNSNLFKKGYLDVTYYNVVADTNTVPVATANVTNINQAIKDAYNLNNDTPITGTGLTLKGSLALYFPPGTYYINGTLQAYTATGRPIDEVSLATVDGLNHATPGNHLAIVGATNGAARPVIRLRNSTFTDASDPHVVLEFKNTGCIQRHNGSVLSLEPGTFIKEADADGNVHLTHDEQTVFVEAPASGYHQMLRGIDIDCGFTNAGAIGLGFNQAQESSVENVKITVGGGLTGIRGLPGRGWGAVNVEVVGGNVGIDLTAYTNPGTGPGIPSTSNVGSVIVGAKLTGQRVTAIAFGGFVPLSVVGFEISQPTSGTIPTAALTIQPGTQLYNSLINLIDGKITLKDTNRIAIDNTQGKSLYVRNVYVSGGNQLVAYPSTVWTATGTTNRIIEYSYKESGTIPINGEEDSNGVVQQVDQTVQQFTGAFTNFKSSATGTTDDLVARHVWGRLPSVDDTDAHDFVAEKGITFDANGAATISSKMLQDFVNANSKVFLRKGIYRLDGNLGTQGAPSYGPVVLKSNTVLYGAARFLTRIEVDPSWTAHIDATSADQKETAMITTQDSATATTYIGDLSIGVDTDDANGTSSTVANGDWFTALDWKAGARSMVHIGQVYRTPALDNDAPTNAHSLLKITGHGGGRWFFAGARKTSHAGNDAFRILKDSSTAGEPLSIYGLNLEHPGGSVDPAVVGPREYAEFNSAKNVRVYGVKTEFVANDTASMSAVIRVTNGGNLGVFGMGAIRNGLDGGKGSIDFFCPGPNSGVLATLIAPQTDDFSISVTGARTLRKVQGTTTGVAYPNVVSIFNDIDNGLDDTLIDHGPNVTY